MPEPKVMVPINPPKQYTRPCPIDQEILYKIKYEDPRYAKNLADIQIRSILSTSQLDQLQSRLALVRQSLLKHANGNTFSLLSQYFT